MSSLPGVPRITRSVEQQLAVLQTTVNGLSSPTRRVGDSITLTGQTATIATTNIITSARNGIYRYSAVLQCTTADALAGTITLTIGWTDRVGATTTTLTRLLTVTGRNPGDLVLQVEGDTNITYAIGIAGIFGTAVYALELRLERIDQ